MDAPTLSIVMPIYNHPEWVNVMVDSIRANDFEDWELWAVDDGSEIETVETLKGEFDKDSRIHYISRGDRQPKGAQTCRNLGLEMAQGEYIIFFDSDDWVAPYCLSSRIEAIRKANLDFMVFPSGVIRHDYYDTQEHEFAFGYPIFLDDYDAFARRILPFIVWNNIYRVEALRKSGIMWDTNLLSLQDADFNLQALVAGLKYAYAFPVRPDMGYRIDAGSGSVSKKLLSEEHMGSTLYAIEKFYKMYQSRFGHRYDMALYRGVLFLYNYIMTEGLMEPFADDMVALVARYSHYGVVMKTQVTFSKVLCKILPSKRARQLPMLFHLVDYYCRIQRKKKAIKKLLSEGL